MGEGALEAPPGTAAERQVARTPQDERRALGEARQVAFDLQQVVAAFKDCAGEHPGRPPRRGVGEWAPVVLHDYGGNSGTRGSERHAELDEGVVAFDQHPSGGATGQAGEALEKRA